MLSKKDHNAELSQLLKEAESILFERKTFDMQSSRSHIVNAMMSTLFQKSEREQNILYEWQSTVLL